MERSPEFQEIIETIQREHRHTQLVFGLGIVVLSGVLMYVAPAVIRTEFANSVSSLEPISNKGGMHGGAMEKNDGQSMMVQSTTTVTSTTTHATSTKK
jgi:hypothetical protein